MLSLVVEEWGESFSLRRPQDARGAPVDFVYEGKTMLGWASLIANLSPRRTSRNPRNTNRYSQGLRTAIIEAMTNDERLAVLLDAELVER